MKVNGGDTTFIPLQGETELVVGSDRTGDDGTALLVNLPPDKSHVFTLRDEDGRRVLSKTFSILTRGASQNVVFYFPRYSAVAAWLVKAQQQ